MSRCKRLRNWLRRKIFCCCSNSEEIKWDNYVRTTEDAWTPEADDILNNYLTPQVTTPEQNASGDLDCTHIYQILINPCLTPNVKVSKWLEYCNLHLHNADTLYNIFCCCSNSEEIKWDNYVRMTEDAWTTEADDILNNYLNPQVTTPEQNASGDLDCTRIYQILINPCLTPNVKVSKWLEYCNLHLHNADPLYNM